MLITAERLRAWLKPSWKKVLLCVVTTLVGVFCGIFLNGTWSLCCKGYTGQLPLLSPVSPITPLLSTILLGPYILLNEYVDSPHFGPVIVGGEWILAFVYYYLLLSIPKIRIATIVVIIIGLGLLGWHLALV